MGSQSLVTKRIINRMRKKHVKKLYKLADSASSSHKINLYALVKGVDRCLVLVRKRTFDFKENEKKEVINPLTRDDVRILEVAIHNLYKELEKFPHLGLNRTDRSLYMDMQEIVTRKLMFWMSRLRKANHIPVI